MTKTLLIPLPGNEKLAANIAQLGGMTLSSLSWRRFPDMESYLCFDANVKDHNCALVCTLDRPDEKFLALSFLSSLLKDKGARRVGLVAPYLGYMRQDKAFKNGEAVTSIYFAQLLSQQFDWLLTIDPHLHRHKSLAEIYTIPARALHAHSSLAQCIQKQITKPFLIGPDEESRQWVATVAEEIGAPFTVLRKIRRGDKDVEVSLPDVEAHHNRTPVLLDDIASSGRTLIAAVETLSGLGLAKPVVVVIHPVFAGTAYKDLSHAGAHKIFSCNTIEHISNSINIAPLLIDGGRAEGFWN
ncbi:MAG: ribose-phosphate diphosphokinase [Oligoflexales bacterium]|nr:ribose-phosphate diphosphokinase [Oligoflexales bacterium]